MAEGTHADVRDPHIEIRVAHITTAAVSLRALLLDQLLYLQDRGVRVITMSADGPEVKQLVDRGIRHFSLPLNRRLFSPISDLRSLMRITRVLRREGIRVVHTHTPKASVLGQIAGVIARVPIRISTLHGLFEGGNMPHFQKRLVRSLEMMGVRLADVVLSQNNEDLIYLRERRVELRTRLMHLGNGIDLNRFDPHMIDPEMITAMKEEVGVPATAPIVGFVGRLSGERKGLWTLIRAAPIIRERFPGAVFLLVGKPDWGKSDCIDPSGVDGSLAESFRFLGYRENNDLPALYAIMDALVLPSTFEGVPRVVMEAAAMAVPSVVSDVKGNREVIEDGFNGFLFPYGDEHAMAKAVLAILEDESLRRKLGSNAREGAVPRFDQQSVFDQVFRCYQQALAKHRG